MNEHFQYLLEDKNVSFFQKAAHDEAAVIADRALQHRRIQKTASPLLRPIHTVDRDINMLKVAGPVGINLGMVRRADAYIDRLYERTDLTADELETIFDKIAGEAIHTDLEAARAHLYGLVELDQRPWVDASLAKIAVDMIRAAQLEKRAGPLGFLRMFGRGAGAASAAGLGSAARGVGRLGAGIGRGVGEAGAMAGRGIARSTTGAARGVGRAGSWAGEQAMRPIRAGTEAIRAKRLAGAEKQLRGIQENISTMGAKPPNAFRRGAMTSLENQQTSAAKTLAKRQEGANLRAAAKAPHAAPTTAPIPTGSPTSQPIGTTPGNAPKRPTPPLKEAPAAAAVSPPKPPDASGLPKTPEPAAPATTEAAKPKTRRRRQQPQGEVGGGAPAGAEGAVATAKGPGFAAAYKKMRDSGWKSLSGQEKQSLINAGALGVIGGRLVTGHGVITGGEGLI